MEEEVEGTYRLLQTPGARLGAQTIPGVSTLEPQQSLSSALAVASPKLRGRRIQLTLRLLDNTEEQFEVEQKAYGESLMNEVFLRLNLTESDYFGLEFQNSLGNEIWLEPAKLIVKQVQRPKNTILRLSVKFFPPDPGQLQEEYTRYLFALQIKRDLAESRLMCNENTAALLTSHLLQSEIGDYDEALDRAHLKENTLLPNQEKLQEKIMEFHRKHMGHTPAESDFQVLEIARKLEMYGIRFHPASDREGTKINLSVAHMGVLVFQGNVKINTFNWSKIRKLSFKRKRFLIKLHPEVHGPYQDTLEFLLGDRDLCKIFWKNCVEYHTFFRLMDQPKAKAKPVFLSRGSSFRYSIAVCLVQGFLSHILTKYSLFCRRHGRAQVSPRNLSADVPKQSLSVTECLEVPGSPSSATISFQSIQSTYKSAADHQPVHPDNARVLLDKTAQRSPAEVKMSPVFEQAWKKNSDHPSSVSLQGSVAEVAASCSPCSSVCDEGSSVAREDYSEGRPTQKNDNDEDDYTRGIFITENEYNVSQLRGRAMPVFTLTNAQLQLTEEFIDDDPAEISFFAGGSEAFSPCYSGLGNSLNGLACYNEQDHPPTINSNLSKQIWSSRKYGNNNVEVGSDEDFEFEGGSDFNGNGRAINTADLFEVKEQVNRMHGHFSRSETSSLVNNRSQSSSLTNLGLNGLSETASFRMANSANQSEASSMVNFPTYSVRSESSSALQFGDVIDQFEHLSYPPTTTEDSTSSGSGSWDSDHGVPLEGNFFYSNPFAQVTANNFTFSFKNDVNGCAHGEREERSSLC
uniref:FERM, ARH/RhoGEF and pleckstrin domain protein 2 n=1 Tax=Callorhinchus milii TaxID=7868 RepID=A0A4W3IKM1_CALMI